MKTSRKTLLALIGAMAVGAAVAAPSVEIVSVQQQYPWTNTVDIVYNVAGVASETNGYFVVFTPTTSTGEPILDVSGETSVQVALKGSGVYSTQWFPQTNLQYTACKMTPSVFRGAAKDYMIVDLETGAVTYEPMATQAASNQRYQAAEYKTRKMVFRKVAAGEYRIGDKNNYSGKLGHLPHTSHTVKFAEPYYLAIYEATAAQYNWLVNGSDSTNSDKPKSLSWNTLRGNALTVAVPNKGFFATLNQKTKMTGFDLPTMAMYEVAARAGIETGYFSGDSYSYKGGMSTYCWCSEDGSSIRSVGTRSANAWGFYDLIGNAYDRALDARPANGTDLKSVIPENGFKPALVSGATMSLFYGGDTGSTSDMFHFSGCGSAGYNSDSSLWGFRVALYPSAHYPNGGK